MKIYTVPPSQLDLFNPLSPLLGVRVVRSDPCPKCRSFTAAIGTREEFDDLERQVAAERGSADDA